MHKASMPATTNAMDRTLSCSNDCAIVGCDIAGGTLAYVLSCVLMSYHRTNPRGSPLLPFAMSLG